MVVKCNAKEPDFYLSWPATIAHRWLFRLKPIFWTNHFQCIENPHVRTYRPVGKCFTNQCTEHEDNVEKKSVESRRQNEAKPHIHVSVSTYWRKFLAYCSLFSALFLNKRMKISYFWLEIDIPDNFYLAITKRDMDINLNILFAFYFNLCAYLLLWWFEF